MNIDEFDAATLDFGVTYDDVFVGRHPEDGSELYAQVIFVKAVAPDGTVFSRYVGTYGWVTNEDGFAYRKAFHDGKALDLDFDGLFAVGRGIADRLNEAEVPNLNPNVWNMTGAVYGSIAYQTLGLEDEQIERERRAEWEI